MGSPADHWAKWMSNRTFLATVDPNHTDWLITVAFYTAVHAVECLLAGLEGRHSSKHTDREVALKMNNRYSNIWLNYHPLANAGWLARYECEGAASGKPRVSVSLLDARNVFVKQHLHKLEQSVVGLLVRYGKRPANATTPLAPPQVR